MKSIRREKAIFLASLLVLLLLVVFVAGFASRHFQAWPTNDILLLAKQVKAYRRTGRWGLVDQYIPANVSADQPRYAINDQSKFLAGYRAILGYDVDLEMFSVRLYDESGQKIHAWPVDHRKLSGKSEFNDAIIPHGMEILRDGSVVVNFDRFVGVMSRIDACGEPIWTRQGIYHHSIHSDDDGGLWTWYSPDHPSGQQQSIVKLDGQTGDTILEIPLEQLSRQSSENAMILGVPDDFSASASREVPKNQSRDIFHPNDVEPLTAEFAPFFEMFEEGDLLISLRNLNLVAVLDPNTLSFDWAMHGPWIQQHDPDFTRDGTIEIYDNATGRGRSEIVSVDPETGMSSRLFGMDSPKFYSERQGKHQRLPSGARLITVPKEGRVLEFSESGELIAEFNNVASGRANAAVLNAVWLPSDYFSSPPDCQ